MIIDAHTHINNEKKYEEYFAKAKGKVEKLFSLFYFSNNLAELLEFAATKDNLFIIGSIDTDGNIESQLQNCEKLFQEKKIYGIKLYPGYQYFYPSDEKIQPIAKLCQKYNKPLIFHSGDVYSPDNKAILKYSHPIHIDELAVNFPECQIVISHFGFPYFLETANVVSKNKNVYTDISGTIDETDGGKKEAKKMRDQYLNDLIRVFNYFPDIKQKIMFGTDFGGEQTPLNLVNPYIDLVNKLFAKKERESVFHALAEKIYFSVNE